MTYLAAGAGALAPGLLLLSRSRATLLAGFGLLAVAEGALLADRQVGEALPGLVGSPYGLAALVTGLIAVVALAALLVRHPIAVAPLALVAAPLRPPLELGAGGGFPVELATSGELGRLLPLYGVLAAAVLALAWRVVRGEPVRRLPLVLAVPATAFLGFVAASILWARDPPAAADELGFFWLPFAVLLAVVARTSVEDPRLARLLAAALVVSALVFAAVGIYQAAVGRVFFSSPDLAAGNAYGSLFRVTSLFDDPSHYGRHLVLAIVVVLVGLWLGRTRLWPSVAALLVLGAGLWLSYSQSSMVALVVTVLALALVAGDRSARRVAAATAAALAVGGAVLLGAQAGDSGRSVTSERSRLVEDTAVVFANHPVVGVGVAGQPLATREEARARGDLRRNASHTTPLTVAAELGAIGLVGYVALLLGGVRVLAVARARDPALGLGLAAVLLALFVHSLSYDGFFDNPITWGVLGLGAAVPSGAPPGRHAPAAIPATRLASAGGEGPDRHPAPERVSSGG